MWLLELLLGIDPAPWAEGGGARVSLHAAPSGDRALLLLLLAAGTGYGLYRLYRLDARRLARLPRWLLTALRGVALAAALLMLLEPMLILSRTEYEPSNLLLLVDRSSSMKLRDAWRDEQAAQAVAAAAGIEAAELPTKDRSQLVDGVFTESLLQQLTGAGERKVHRMTFAGRLNGEPTTPDADPAAPPPLEEPGGAAASDGMGDDRTTAIGSAIQQALTAYRGMPLAGIVVVSDGQSNAGLPPAQAARSLAKDGVPVFTVAVGTADGPRNLAITDLSADPVVFARDTNRITAFVEGRGMTDQAAELTLEVRRDGGPWEAFAAQPVEFAGDGTRVPVTFEFTEPNPTRLTFRASVTTDANELTRDDNTALTQVRVVRQQLRVLFIAGTTFPEVQFIRNALLRDKRIDVSTWLMDADRGYTHPGDRPLRRLPATQEELDNFDCLVLYDPDPRAWPSNYPELLTNFVGKAGGGLVYIAGERFTKQLFDRQASLDAGWLRMLPVVREPGLFRSAVQLRLSARNAWRLEITDAGRRDPIFAFDADPERNKQIISSLPGMFWHFPVTRARAGATVLAHHGDPRMRNQFGPEVLLATQLVGPGRTFFVGFDSTYRWRYVDEDVFDGFWARMIDRAGRTKQLGGIYPFRLSTGRAAYQPGDQVRVIATFTDAQQIDAGLESLHAEVERGEDAAHTFALVATGKPGEFEGRFTAERAGPHLVRVWPGDSSLRDSTRPASLEVRVDLPNLEYANPVVDAATLQMLASDTGGKAIGLAEAGSLPELIRVGKVAHVLEDRQEIWDAPLLVALIFVPLVAEWLLRKRYRLV